MPAPHPTVPMACPPAGNKLFAGLEPRTVAKAVAHCVRESYQPGGKKIFEEGDDGDALYLVESGEVRIFKGTLSGEETLARVEAGDYFGEMALFSGHRRSASAVAEVVSCIWRMSFADFTGLLHDEPRLNENLLDGAHHRLRELDERYLKELIHRERLSIVGRMAASIIHDFKGPLTAIRGLAELIEMDSKDPATAKNTRIITREVDQLVAMVSELLDYARSAKNLNRQPTRLKTFFDDTLGLLRQDFERRGIKIEMDASDDPPVSLDPQRFQRVLYNLAMNAADAMPKGGTLRLSARQHDDGCHIEVSDTGCGIPPELQERVWQPFATFGKKQGSGLGLPIARKVVEDHGGAITLRSEVGKGTTFEIRLPVNGPPTN